MSDRPYWLPDLMCVDGEWSKVLEELYQIFRKDIKEGALTLGGCPIWWDRVILPSEKYEEGFWHLITRQEPGEERLFDTRRAERLPWIRAIILNSKDPLIKFWEEKRTSRKIRLYLWLEAFNYVVCLEKREQRVGKVYFLLTGYFVSEGTAKKFARIYRDSQSF